MLPEAPQLLGRVSRFLFRELIVRTQGVPQGLGGTRPLASENSLPQSKINPTKKSRTLNAHLECAILDALPPPNFSRTTLKQKPVAWLRASALKMKYAKWRRLWAFLTFQFCEMDSGSQCCAQGFEPKQSYALADGLTGDLAVPMRNREVCPHSLAAGATLSTSASPRTSAGLRGQGHTAETFRLPPFCAHIWMWQASHIKAACRTWAAGTGSSACHHHQQLPGREKAHITHSF